MGYRLSAKVGGAFTDLLLLDASDELFWRHKTISASLQLFEAVLTGLESIGDRTGIAPDEIACLLQGTSAATEGHRSVMQVARSYVPGSRAGSTVCPTPTPLAPLEDNVTSKGRMDAQDGPARPLDEDNINQQIGVPEKQGVEVMTVALNNACVGGSHETAVERLRKRCEAKIGFPAKGRSVWPNMEAAN